LFNNINLLLFISYILSYIEYYLYKIQSFFFYINKNINMKFLNKFQSILKSDKSLIFPNIIGKMPSLDNIFVSRLNEK